MGLKTTLKKNKWMLKLITSSSFKEKKKIISGFSNAKQYYKVENTSTDMKKMLKCALCPNMCRFECPVLRATKKEMYAPATKARLCYHMERGSINFSDLHSAEVPYFCTNCDGCRTWCPMDISTGDLLRGVRADLMKKEIYIPGVKEYCDKVIQNKTSFTAQTFKADSSININMDNPEVFYYCGCVMAEKKISAVKANIEILKTAGISFCTYTSERECCAGPLYTLGFDSVVKQFGERNIALIGKSGAKIVVTDCPACANTIANTYKTLGLKHNFKVLTTVQYYKQLIEEGKLKLIKPVNTIITYHDPCITVRKLDRHEFVDTGNLNFEKRYNKEQHLDPARFIFSQIPQLTLKEVFLHGQQTQCCGRGGVSHIHHAEISDEIGKQRVEQLKSTGAEYIVSSCPACEEGFIANGGSNCLDIAEIILKSIK